jgi:hypothetical protein
MNWNKDRGRKRQGDRESIRQGKGKERCGQNKERTDASRLRDLRYWGIMQFVERC